VHLISLYAAVRAMTVCRHLLCMRDDGRGSYSGTLSCCCSRCRGRQFPAQSGTGRWVDRVLRYSLLRCDDVPRQRSLGRVNENVFRVLATAWAIMAVTAAMIVIVLIRGELAAWMQVDSPLVRLALFFFTGAVTYGATLFAIGDPVISEGAEVPRWILRRRSTAS
jgi:hypothetical protein